MLPLVEIGLTVLLKKPPSCDGPAGWCKQGNSIPDIISKTELEQNAYYDYPLKSADLQRGYKKAMTKPEVYMGMQQTSNKTNTVQYRPSEKMIVFGLKVPPGDGLGLIL